MTDRRRHPKYPDAVLVNFMDLPDGEVCNTCPEFQGLRTDCSGCCGYGHVWVSEVRFVELKLEGREL